MVWCPTGDVIADYATKPLQGSLFKKFRDQIMGVIPIIGPGTRKKAVNKKRKSLRVWCRSKTAPQECVGIIQFI